MTEQQPSQDSLAPGARRTAPFVRTESNRRSQVLWGSFLAGLGLSITAAIVMHVVQEASPLGGNININGAIVVVVLIAGPIFALGIGAALEALIPRDSADAPATATPTTSAEPPAH
jgi:hypothetical protein